MALTLNPGIVTTLLCDDQSVIQAFNQKEELWISQLMLLILLEMRQEVVRSNKTSPCDAEKRQKFTNEKLYLRIPTSVDAIIFTMQNGK